MGNLRWSIRTAVRGRGSTADVVDVFPDVQGERPVTNRVILRTQESGSQWRHGIHPTTQYAQFQPSAYTIPYPFSPTPVLAPNSSSRLASPGLTPASQSSIPPRSQPFPTGHCQKAFFGTEEAVVVVDWTGSNNPSVQSKVAPASDSVPEPSVK
ncbi:hypothetical protein BU17DRAFT_71723 [Hysterangium stoloniferum]|nr:hypothetical protein BU17DRAFT_71723 [Hysterangium stoloniferum]